MVKIASIQMESTADPLQNLKIASDLLDEAARQGSTLALLPENFYTLGSPTDKIESLSESYKEGIAQQTLSEKAKQHKMWIVGGTLPIRSPESKKLFASALVWNPSGNCVHRYDKIHLFDVLLEERDVYSESTLFRPGQNIKILSTPFGKIGIAVCYDIRFPELFRALMLQGADIFLIPAAFTIPTGKVHWETLLKARAIENLCYVVASGEIGKRPNGVGTYGHSMIINPWGEVLASIQHDQGVIAVECDLIKMHKLRQSFPVLTHCDKMVLQELSRQREN